MKEFDLDEWAVKFEEEHGWAPDAAFDVVNESGHIALPTHWPKDKQPKEFFEVPVSQLYLDITADPYGEREFNEVFDNDTNWGIDADVDFECLCCGGETYRMLAEMIPKNRVVYDFGAAYGFQSWYFRNHRRYIAIQPQPREEKYQIKKPFRTDNSIWYFGTAQEFFKQFSIERESFAICNYVPDEEAARLVREHCPNVFCNYPQSGDLSRRGKEPTLL